MPYGRYGSDSELRLHWASQTSNQDCVQSYSYFRGIIKRNPANCHYQTSIFFINTDEICGHRKKRTELQKQQSGKEQSELWCEDEVSSLLSGGRKQSAPVRSLLENLLDHIAKVLALVWATGSQQKSIIFISLFLNPCCSKHVTREGMWTYTGCLFKCLI